MPSRRGISVAVLLTLWGLCLSDEAIRCPPCSEEKLARCKAPVGCEETVREPGCGCCPTCALAKGNYCGVYSPRCGSGMRCFPPPGVEKPLHSLMLGQGICMAESELTQLQTTENEELWNLDHPNNSHIPCSPQDKKCLLRHQAKIREQGLKNGKMKNNVNREENKPLVLPPCQSEMQRALDRLASQTRTHEDFYIIPLPNCDKHGNFHPKQCLPALDGQRGKCWCVDQKTGIQLVGTPEVKGELDCHQFVESIRE
ncbi:insulin-like growth factor-binding protein 4 [Acipenser oxyrinchus oxyrinchus]|uniref:Insulin-like growth factor-binding protein 4 n=1 Tax=Acipenser oxyrinchus oxyrinchus TaxID=40147 RepID=A0AAD8CY54_ACIOX|nr:insulin-like growth factor-binding protein 4 [Acipenser oxyrinchus oxyrinchus]